VPGHAHRLIYLDRLATLQTERIQAEIIGMRNAPDRDEQLIAGERAAVLELELDRAGAVLAPHRRGLRAEHDLRTGILEGVSSRRHRSLRLSQNRT
jgi:hypothetical protein